MLIFPNLTPRKRLLITITVMCVTIVEVIDMTIVNVAMPHMMGSLSANTQQITWILTSYIVAAAVMMPLTGLLSQRYGIRNLLLINIAGFGVASFLCGLATNLVEIVVFRLLQGAFGAGLVPLSQTVLRYTHPKEEMGKAMAIWGIGIMVGPVLGPVIGAYITEYFNWRMIFYINIPICLTAFFLTVELFPKTKMHKNTIDWLGLVLLMLATSNLQLFLDLGNELGWLQSNLIIMHLSIFLITSIWFTVRGLKQKNNIFNLHLFRDFNFTFACIVIAVFGLSMFSSIILLPLMLQNVLGYPVAIVGLLSAPTGLASGVAMAISGSLMHKVRAHYLIAVGLLLSYIGAYMRTAYGAELSTYIIVVPQIFSGLGMGLFFVPLGALAFSTLDERFGSHSIAEASGIYNFCRSIGSSIGISLVSTVLSRTMQTSWQALGHNINIYNPNLWQWLHQQHYTHINTTNLTTLAAILGQQSLLLAFIDAYWFVAMSFLVVLLLFLAWLIKDCVPWFNKHPKIINKIPLKVEEVLH